MVLSISLDSAVAEENQGSGNLRCMAVMAKLNQYPDPRHQLESLIGGYYYLGRLNSAPAVQDIAQLTADAFAKMSAAEFLSETARCEKEMQALGKQMTGIAAAMPKSPSASPPTSASPPQKAE
jgi:hypothetical protein